MRKLLIASAAVVLAGCQTWGPTWSEVTGQRWNLTNLNTVPTSVQTIDGNSAFGNTPGQPIKATSGEHVIVLAAAPLSPGWTGGTDLETVKINLEPCKRYYLNGVYDNRLGMSWKPFIDYVEPIAGCTVTPAK
jgi:hypothetical protein